MGRRDVGQERQLPRRGRVRQRPEEAARDPGAGHVLRVQRCAHQPVRAFAGCESSAAALPDVLKENIMDQIGASNDWKWSGYGPKSTVEINDKHVESVSGGTRWGGGLWMQLARISRASDC